VPFPSFCRTGRPISSSAATHETLRVRLTIPHSAQRPSSSPPPEPTCTLSHAADPAPPQLAPSPK
jgi:hypothetical protein